MPDVNIDIPFGKLDTKTDPAMLANGALTQAVNVSTQSNGIYKKRFGYTNLASLSSGATRLATHRGTLLGFDGSNQLSVYSPTGSKWNANAKANLAMVSRQQVSRNASNTTSTDVAYLSGFYAIVFVQSGTATLVIIDSATGKQTSSVTVSSVRDGARILPLGTSFILLYSDSGTASRISYFRFSPTTGFVGSGAIVTDQSTTCVALDACAYDANTVLLFYGTTGNTGKLVTVNTSITVTTRDTLPGTLLTGSTGPLAVLSTATNEIIYVAFATSLNAVHIRMYNASNFVLVTADVVVYTASAAVNALALGRLSASSVIVLVQVHSVASTSPDFVVRTAWTSGGVSAGTNGTLNGVWLAGKPFVVGGKMYALCYYPAFSHVTGNTGIQPTYFLCDIHSDTVGVATGSTSVVARAAFQAASATRGSISAVVSANGTNFFYAGTLQLKLPNETTAFQGAVDLIGFDFANATANIFAEGAQNTAFASGAPQVFDGLGLRTWSYEIFPEAPKLTASGAGGSMATGTYLYKLCYERVDNNGDAVISSPSLPASVSVTGPTGSVSVQFLYDWFTLAATELPAQGIDVDRVGIYRTLAGGTQYFKIGEVNNISTNTGVVTFSDTFADATISVNAQLYTNGGALEHEPPAASDQFICHQNAFYYISSEDPSLVSFSPQFVGDGMQPWFNQALSFRVDSGGDIIALASMDDKLIVFKADRIFVVTGQVSNSTGGGASLSDPQLISSDCGCIEPRSVVVTPGGVLFLSAKGIYLLDRGLQVQYVGAPVDAYVTANGTCSSAVMLTDRREVRFAMSNGSTGVWLVYNYDADAWTTFVLETTGLISVSAVQSSLGYAWLGQNGVPRLESTTAYSDADGSYVPMTLETGWVKFAGLQGLGRIRRVLLLADPVAQFIVAVSIANGYDPTYVQTVGFAYGGGGGAPRQFSVQLATMKSDAWRFRIIDSANGLNNSAAFLARGLTIEARVKPGGASRLLAAAQKG